MAVGGDDHGSSERVVDGNASFRFALEPLLDVLAVDFL